MGSQFSGFLQSQREQANPVASLTYQVYPTTPKRYLSPDEIRLLGEMAATTHYDGNLWKRATVMDITGSRRMINEDNGTRVDYFPHMGDYFYQKSNRAFPVRSKSFADNFSNRRLAPTPGRLTHGYAKDMYIPRIMGQVTVPQ